MIATYLFAHIDRTIDDLDLGQTSWAVLRLPYSYFTKQQVMHPQAHGPSIVLD